MLDVAFSGSFKWKAGMRHIATLSKKWTFIMFEWYIGSAPYWSPYHIYACVIYNAHHVP